MNKFEEKGSFNNTQILFNKLMKVRERAKGVMTKILNEYPWEFLPDEDAPDYDSMIEDVFREPEDLGYWISGDATGSI